MSDTVLSPKGQLSLNQARECLQQFEQTRRAIYLDLTHYYLFRVREAELPVWGETTSDEMQMEW